MTRDPSLQFKVHYHGWSAAWDEWVTKSRLLPFTAKNEEKKKELDLLLVENVKRQKKRKIEKESSCSRGRNKKKRSNNTNNNNQQSTDDTNISKMALKIPFNLQKQLVMDWERVHKNEFVSLPTSPSVVELLEKWAAQQRRKKHTPSAQNSINVLVRGLTEFFDGALSQCLLYAFEREQYESELKKFKSKNKKKLFKPSEIYGAQHFLRLFVKLPALFVDMNVSEEDHAFFQPQLNEILKFLQKGSMFSNKSYVPASEKYVNSFREKSSEGV